MIGRTLKLASVVCLLAYVSSSSKKGYLTGKHSKAIVDPENCFFDGQRTCYSCKNAALCVETSGGMTAYDEPCYTYGEVCNIASNDVEAACTSTPAVDEPGAACFCNPSLAQPRTESDPYTDHAYIYCDNDYSYYYTCFNNYIFNPAFGDCAPEPPTCKYIGRFPFEDDCEFYYICNTVGSPGLVQQCGEGEFFDPNTDDCETDPDSTVSCYDDNSQPITGTVGSPIYCSYYYVCDNGTFISTEGCPVGTIYNADDSECVTDDGSCISTGYCF